MKKRIALVVAAVFVVLAAVVVLFPAERGLAMFGPDAIEAEGVSGSIWRGSAKRIRHGDAPALDDVSWRIRVASLLDSEPAYDVDFTFRQGEGSGIVTFDQAGNIRITDTTWNGPANGIGEWLGLPWLVFDGGIRVHIDRARLERGELRQVVADLEWTDAEIREPMRFPLGTIQGRLAPDESDGGYRAAVEAEGGQIRVRGDGSLNAHGEYEVEFRLRPASGASAEVYFLLDAIASRDSGEFIIRQRGRID